MPRILQCRARGATKKSYEEKKEEFGKKHIINRMVHFPTALSNSLLLALGNGEKGVEEGGDIS